jgi:DNA-binding MarR family transcriptional regulator
MGEGVPSAHKVDKNNRGLSHLWRDELVDVQWMWNSRSPMERRAHIVTTQEEPGSESMRSRLVNARLLTLMAMVSESATLAYRRRLHMPDSARQVLFLIGAYGSLTSKDIALFSGREKAQISRSVNALADAGLIRRATRRSPIALSEAGRRLFGKIMAVAKERNAALSRDIPLADSARFLAITGTLIDQASRLYASESSGSGAAPTSQSLTFHPPTSRFSTGTDGALAQMILPWLQSLTTYLQRSGSLVFKREVGLSNFEWRVLSQIGEYEPTTLAFLITRVFRDKSQVARTVKGLHRSGLIDREDEGRTNVALTLSRKGAQCYARMCALAIERDTVLFAECTDQERSFYIEIVDRLTDNARKMLVSEEAAEAESEDAGASPAQRGDSHRTLSDAPPAADEGAVLWRENARLKTLLAEAILENSILREQLARESGAPADAPESPAGAPTRFRGRFARGPRHLEDYINLSWLGARPRRPIQSDVSRAGSAIDLSLGRGIAMERFAHSVEGMPEREWEPLSHHLAAVGGSAAAFAELFGCSRIALVMGLLHDIGKCAVAYQAYIRVSPSAGGRGRGAISF